jgi:hypothetical protein
MSGHSMSASLACDRPWRDAWPLVAQTDDGNPWQTGACWLYCRREGVRVLWIGSVNTPGATGDVYACGPCIAEFDHMVRLQAHARDGISGRGAQSATLTVPVHAPPPRGLPAGKSGGRHRLPGTSVRTPRTAFTGNDDSDS